ncbi:uncharacterized protein LOC135367144 [Ornithodoros turicata]|uniref:uncharacterized protein LOC135367144 n=1 Tax=Ornithodoros turicata TaxID=34597 RepID=UPI00313907C4
MKVLHAVLVLAFAMLASSSTVEPESTTVTSPSSINVTTSSLGIPDNAHAAVITKMKDAVDKRIQSLKDYVVESQGSIPKAPPFVKASYQLGALELNRIGQLVTKIGNTAKTTARNVKRKLEIMAIVLGPIRYSSDKIKKYADGIRKFGNTTAEVQAVKFVSDIVRDFTGTQKPSTHDEAVLQVAELIGSAGESIKDTARSLGLLSKLDEYQLTSNEKKFVRRIASALGSK